MGIPVRRRSSSELQFEDGDRVGPYRILHRVAPSCYDAETVATGEAVRIELASEADSALIDIRFTRAQAQLLLVDHPLVAQIIDHGVLSNGRPWVASQRPSGTALSHVLSQRRLEPREVTALVYSVAQVLAFAHHRQVVHGSLRPHHLTLSRGAKVSISGWAWLRTPGIPAFGDPVNTSVYHPPEHDGQSAIDGRADVYALGAIAYRALTGVFPDVSRDLLDPRDPLGRAIENMLALDARQRSSAAAIVADLHEQRVADRAASKARASSPSLDATDVRLACAEKEIEELRARRASAPSVARASSPRVDSVERRGVERRERPRPSTRPMSTSEYRSRDQPPGIERSTRPMSSVEYAERGLAHAVEPHRRFVEIESALHDVVDEPNTDRVAAPDQELTDLSPHSMTMSALEIDETELVSPVDPTDRTSL